MAAKSPTSKTKKAQSTAKTAEQAVDAAPRGPWRRRIKLSLLVAVLLAILIGTVHVLRLDFVIRDKFSALSWQLPAQIYAAPMELYAGQRLDRAAIVDELERLGYRQTPAAERVGTYALGGGRIVVNKRPFRFWDGDEPAARLRVRFGDGGIRRVSDADTEDDAAIARIDPLLIGSIYSKQGEDRVLTRLEDVPPLLIETLIEIEDRKFRSHHGVDFKGIVRALLANARAGEVVQGGSTITQQLVKNLFLTAEQTYVRKANEAVMAALLEWHYDKDAILEAYVNEIYLGQDGPRAIHGFGLASRFYFGKPLGELQAPEIALLVGMIRGPSYYNPRRRANRAQERRNLVLSKMAEADLLTAEQAQQAKQQALGIAERAGRSSSQFPAFVELVRRQLREQYAQEDLTDEGLQVFTTLRPGAQIAAERAAANGLSGLEAGRSLPADSLETAVVVTAVDSGEVVALVGARDGAAAGFNRALDAARPIGSLAKPMVYLAALRNPRRYTLATPLNDTPVRLELPNGDVWEPQNYDEELHGTPPMFEALSKSYNLATVNLSQDIGLDAVAQQYVDLGGERPQAFDSLALGAVERSPLAVAQLYNTIAAGGYVTPLQSIRAVLTRQGEPVQRYGLELRQGVDATPILLLQWAMNRVMRDGTARSAQRTLRASTLAGKTGTTDELRDSWFAGFGGDLSAVVWVGRDDNTPAGLTGAGGALQVWAQVMRELNPSAIPLYEGGTDNVWIDPMSSMRADSGCEDRVLVPFAPGSAPMNYAPCANGYDPYNQQPGNGQPGNGQPGNQRPIEPPREGRSIWERLFGDD